MLVCAECQKDLTSSFKDIRVQYYNKFNKSRHKVIGIFIKLHLNIIENLQFEIL